MIDRDCLNAGPSFGRSALMRLCAVTRYQTLGFLRIGALEVAPCNSFVSGPQEVVAGYIDEVKPPYGDPSAGSEIAEMGMSVDAFWMI
jgi:hypothetical protein